MLVRAATAEDAGPLCAVLRRSIEELCIDDHGGDSNTIRHWLANKTPDTVLGWIQDPDQRVVVAEDQGVIVGGGAAVASGEVTLNYVAPEARFSGVSKAILRDLEAYLREMGHAQCRLSSTRTAYRFYRAAGYAEAGPPRSWGRLSGQPMTKQL